MELLARRDRKPRRADTRFKPGGRRQRWTFEEAMKALARRLEALGIPIPPPPEAAGGTRGDTYFLAKKYVSP